MTENPTSNVEPTRRRTPQLAANPIPYWAREALSFLSA
jgi:hypothetical protein